jgi:hypothetical protein
MELRTDHLLLDEQGPTITAFGYEISWLGNALDPRPGTGSELIIERLRDGRSWNLEERVGTVDRNGEWGHRGWVAARK